MPDCFFCELWKTKPHNLFLEDSKFYAVFDPAPVSKGHCQIIPKEHVNDFFDLKSEDSTDLHKFILKVKKVLDKKYNPDGYNVGVNCGSSAGQSIMHLHIHIIPRYSGDVDNPKGGIRNIFGKYVSPKAPRKGFK
jgi:diadenosine tetraphosphate (Ap4A) HIT family hydrolase